MNILVIVFLLNAQNEVTHGGFIGTAPNDQACHAMADAWFAKAGPLPDGAVRSGHVCAKAVEAHE